MRLTRFVFLLLVGSAPAFADGGKIITHEDLWLYRAAWQFTNADGFRLSPE